MQINAACISRCTNISMTADLYEEKAEQCERLARSCTDPAAVEVLKKLAREYRLIALAIRNNDQDDEEPDC